MRARLARARAGAEGETTFFERKRPVTDGLLARWKKGTTFVGPGPAGSWERLMVICWKTEFCVFAMNLSCVLGELTPL